MRDYTSNEYCDFLWISDLLALKNKSGNRFKATLRRNGTQKSVVISKVSIFGFIVEIKHIGELGVLYSIDDGTGIIACRCNFNIYNDIMDTVQTEERSILNETLPQTVDESLLDYSSYSVEEDDSIFNDRSIQEEEKAAVKKNRSKALYSIWSSIEDSFSTMVKSLNIGDTVLVEGKLYKHSNRNQLYVNTIRLIDFKEQILLANLKLQDCFEPIATVERRATKDSEADENAEKVNGNRKSGLLTFDHVHHMDSQEFEAVKFSFPGKVFGEVEVQRQKRKSILSPSVHSSLTFDTMSYANDSEANHKLMKLGNND